MPKLIFRGAYVRYVDLRYDDKSKVKYVKINFTAAFSEPVREAMEWGEPPAGFSSAKLDGDLSASHFILTPDGKELKIHELQIDAKSIGNFEVVRVQTGEDSHENELRFQVVTSAAGAASLLESYLEAIGKGTGQLRVNYDRQEDLPLEDKQERLISEEQAHDTSEETDDAEAPLAPAAVMGGTHQRKGREPRKDRGTVN